MYEKQESGDLVVYFSWKDYSKCWFKQNWDKCRKRRIRCGGVFLKVDFCNIIRFSLISSYLCWPFANFNKVQQKSCSWSLKDNLSSWTDRKKMKRKECGGKQWAVGSLFRSQHLNIQLFNDGGKNAKSLSCFLDNLNLNDSLFASFSSKFTKIISIPQSNEVYFRMWRLYIICRWGWSLSL